MTALLITLAERKEEFMSHLALAQAMEERLLDGESVSIGETALTVRHLMTIKSSLIVHLYNIVEALMSRTIEEVGVAVKSSAPETWSISTLKEWLRFNASISLDGNEDSRLEIVHKAARKLLLVEPIDRLLFKKPSGTWSDKVIFQFSQRLNVSLNMPPELIIKIQKNAAYADKTPLEFLAYKRNAIAHGRQTFEMGARNLSLLDIANLADVTIEYMEHVVTSFQVFVNEKRYLAVVV